MDRRSTSKSPSRQVSVEPDGLSFPSIGTRKRKEESENDQEKRLEKMSLAVQTLLECIGEDPTREGLLKTPQRYSKALLFFSKGYEVSVDEIIKNAIFNEDHDEMFLFSTCVFLVYFDLRVIVKNIEIFSLCEHHMVPFFGKVSIGYIPNCKVVGLSKLARLAEAFSRRLQVQERLTRQIATALDDVLQPRGVAVVMEASHLCMVMRGVQKINTTTITSCMLGVFRDDPKTRDEFLKLVKN